MADTELQQLIVWVGTTEKIEQARAQGLITENDFAITTDAPEFQTKLTSANAGTGISITEVGGVVKISNTQTSAEWGNIQGPIQAQTDLWNYLSQIGVLSSLSTTVKTDLVSAINEVYGVANTALQPSDIVNTTSSTATDKALSANMGKSLQDQVDNLKARGRFLALWNCATGLAESNPPTGTYTYQSGDYFIVGVVASSGGTNYKPNGSSYTTGVASTTIETQAVDTDDVYYYDGSVWRLQVNTQKTVSFQNIAGSPYDNTSLGAALNDKQNTISDLETIRSGAAAGATAIQPTNAKFVALNVQYKNDVVPTHDLDLSTITVDKGEATYGFVYDSSLDALVNQNSTMDESYAYGKVSITVPEATTLTVEFTQSSEAGYDFGEISVLDEYLSYNNYEDYDNFEWKGKEYGDYEGSVTYNLTAGEHFFTFKFLKDVSVYEGTDSFSILKITVGEYGSKKLIDYNTQEEIELEGYVKSVNEELPDSNGDVTLYAMEIRDWRL